MSTLADTAARCHRGELRTEKKPSIPFWFPVEWETRCHSNTCTVEFIVVAGVGQTCQSEFTGLAGVLDPSRAHGLLGPEISNGRRAECQHSPSPSIPCPACALVDWQALKTALVRQWPQGPSHKKLPKSRGCACCVHAVSR